MQKFLRTLLLAALMIVPWATQAQSTLTVADGTITNGYVPVYGYYADAYNNAQFIYPAADLAAMGGSEITSLTFYSSSADKSWDGNNFQVYLTETSETTISAYASASDMTLVYDGPVAIVSGEMVITFDENYEYGGGNLQVAFIQNAVGSYSSCSWYGVSSTGSSVQGYSYSGATSASTNQRNFLPKVTFAYEPALACGSVRNLAAEVASGVSMNISWDVPLTPAVSYELNYKVAGAAGDGTTVTVNTTSYTLTGLTPNTAYEVKVRANCGSTGYGNWRTVTAVTDDIIVTNLAAEVTAGVANVSWTAPTTPVVNYQIRYKVAGTAAEGAPVTVNTTNYLITGLETNTTYEISVRANCGTVVGYSDWNIIAVTTDALGCLAGLGNVQVGNGTSTSGYFPSYCLYNYSYNQQIYTAAEIGANGTIYGIAVMPSSAPNPNRDIEIYLGHVTEATSSTWLNPTDLTLVYTGTSNFVAGEWHNFTFQTPFVYNGTDNLVVICRDMTGTWSGTNYFYGHSVAAGTTRYAYRDSGPYTVGDPGVAGSDNGYRNNMIFIGSCEQYAACAAPVVTVTGRTDATVSISWLPGYNENAWDVAYRAADATDWTTVATGINDLAYTFTGLTANTDYEFRVQFACSDANDYSAVVAASTLCTMTLPFTEDFENIEYNGAWPECWIPILNYGTDPSANYEFNHTEDGQYSMYLSANQSYNMFATPLVPADGNNIYVSFWARMSSYSTGSPYIQAGVMTDFDDESTFIPLLTINQYDGEWHQYEFCTKNLDANTAYYVAWKYYGRYTGSTYASAIDDVTIDVIPQYTVTFNITNQEGDADNTEWGTATASATTVLWDDNVTFATTPAEHKRTAAWYLGSDLENAVATDVDEFTLEHVVSDTTVTVMFGYGQFQVTARPNYDNMGSASTNSVYPDDMFDYNTEATLTAVPNYGFDFLEWLDEDGNSLGSENPLTLVALQNYNLTARFFLHYFVLTDGSENGHVEGITHEGITDSAYTYGSLVTLTAVADEHYSFAGWSDGYDGGATRTYRVIKDSTFTALFEPLSYSVAISDPYTPHAASYTINDADYEDVAVSFVYNTEVTVSAADVDDEHYTFVAWTAKRVVPNNFYFYSGDETYNYIGYTLDDDGNVTDVFTFAYHDGYYWADEHVALPDGFEPDLTIATDTWTGTMTVTDTLSTETTYTFNVDADINLIPVYTAQQFTLTIAPNDDNMGSVRFADPEYDGLTSVTVDYNTPVSVIANAAEGSYSGFDSWQIDGVPVSTSANYTVTVSEDIDLVAYFAYGVVSFDYDIEPDQAEIDGATVVGSVNGVVVEQPAFADQFTVTATGTDHWLFDHWTDGFGNDLGTDASFTETVFDGVNYIAYFVRDEHTIIAQTGTDALNNAYGEVYVYDADWNEASVFTHDDYATVEFIPGYGYTFAGWEDEDGNLISTDNPFTFMVESDSTLIATINAIPYDVYVEVYNDGDADYPRGEVSIVSPVNYLDVADPQYTESVYGYVFDFWADDNDEEVTDFTVYEPTTYYAHFKKDIFTVNGAALTGYTMMGYVDGNTEAEYLDQVTLTAVENPGYTFNSWVDADGNALVVDGVNVVAINGNEITIVAGGDHPATEAQWANNTYTVYATFDYNYYGVDLTVVPAGYGTATAMVGNSDFPLPNMVAYSTTLHLTAEPVAHWDFVAWIDGETGDTLSTDANYDHIVSNKDIMIEAHFAIHAYAVTKAVNNEEMGSVEWGAPHHFEESTDEIQTTVADGTGTNGNVPIYGTWADAYNKAHFVYPAADLAAANGGKISSMTFYSSNDNVAWGAANFKVYVAETADATISAFANTDDMTLVYDGPLSIVDGQTTITFDNPFAYTGQNLLVAVNQDVKGSWTSSYWYGITATGASVSGYNSTSPDYIYATQRNFLPKTTFTHTYSETVMDAVEGVEFDGNTAYVNYNSSVVMNAQAEYGYDFIGWATADANGNIHVNTANEPILNGTDLEYTVANVDKDSNVVALFTEHLFSVELTDDGFGTAEAITPAPTTFDANGNPTYAYLTDVTVEATVNAGNHRHFLHWTAIDANGDPVLDEDGNEIVITDNPMTFNITRDTHFVAHFTLDLHTVTADPNNADFGGVYVEDPNQIPVNDLTVADGTDGNAYVPVHGFYADAYLRSQTIYPAADLADMTGANINSLTYYLSSSASDVWTGNFQVRLAEVTDDAISSFQDMTAAAVAYDGALDATGTTMTINFTTPYTYNGGNLLVEVVENTKGNYKSASFYGVNTTGASVQGYNYSSLSAISATSRNFLPKTTFGYAMGSAIPVLAHSEATVEYGNNVNVYATANDNYHFKGWQNSAGTFVRQDDAMRLTGTITEDNFPLTVLGDTAFTAVFAPDTFNVNAFANMVRGYVEPEVTTGAYNEPVTLTATANHGYEFDHWADLNGETISTDNPLDLIVLGDTTVEAVFDYEKYDLNVTVVNGTVSGLINNVDPIEATESFSYNDYYGTVIALLAQPESAGHYTWQGWYNENDELVSDAEYYVINLFDDMTLTAKYEPNPYNVTITANDATMGTLGGDESGVYPYNSTLNVTATPNEHYDFVNWTNGTTVLSSDAEAEITVTGDMDIVANFDYHQYTVTVNVNDATFGAAVADAYSVPVNTLVTFTATPAQGYNFVNWTNADGDEVATTAVFSEVIDADYEVTANFEIADFTLTVQSNDTIMGLASATVEDGEYTTVVTETGIDVTAQYMTNITLTANPKEGYHFVNWTMGGTELSNVETLDVNLYDNLTIVANFYYNNYTVTATSSDPTRGTVAGGTEPGVQEYYYGNIAILTATPLEGYTFKQWVDGDGNVYTTPTVEVLVNGDKTFTAYFIIDGEFTVNAVFDAVQGNVTGIGGYLEGDDATLTATANGGYSFVNWTDENDVVLGTDATLVISNITADTTVYANFGPNDYTVTVTAENGSVEGAGTYAYNSVATLTATPDEHYHFVMWSDNVISNPRNLTVTGDITLEAIFAIDEFAVNATALNGTVEGTGTYAYGTEVTLTATANAIAACYSFDGWYNGATQVATTADYTFTVTENVNLSAVFSALTFAGSEQAAICAGTSYTWNGYNCTTAGTYTYETTTAAGCDSTVTLTLTVNQPQDDAPVIASACETYTWATSGMTYAESGTYTTSITDANGCTANATLYLNILQPANTTETVTACDSYTWHDVVCNTTNVYTYSFTDANGCAATATLNLTINNSTTSTLTEVACVSYTWDATDGTNTTYTESGVYTNTTTNAAGCDHVATLNLTVNQPATSTETVAAEGSYTWNGTTYTTSGVYEYTIAGGAANGCDSIATLNLTISTVVIEYYDVTLNVNDATMGTVNAGGNFAEGSSFSAVATANDGYYFVEWTDGTNTVSTDNPYTFTVNADVTLTAVFAANPVVMYTVTLQSENVDWGTVSAGNTVEAGTLFTATATPATGYHFVAWVNNGVAVSIANPYTFTVNSDITLTARFEADPKPTYTVTVIYDETMGTVTGAGEYTEGTLVTLTATPKTGYRFVSWSTGDTESFLNFTITSDMTITATFELVGIDDVDMENVTIYTADSRIYVKGAEGKQVVLYDVNGRAISREANAAETVEFRVNASGVYLVKVNDAPAKRVVVVR